MPADGREGAGYRPGAFGTYPWHPCGLHNRGGQLTNSAGDAARWSQPIIGIKTMPVFVTLWAQTLRAMMYARYWLPGLIRKFPGKLIFLRHNGRVIRRSERSQG